MLFFTTAVLLASAQAEFYEDCGSKLGTVHAVSVNNCAEDQDLCIIRRNTNGTVTIDFTPTVSASAVYIVIRGIIMNLPCPFSLPQSDVCKIGWLVCPIKANQKALKEFKATAPVLKAYPKVRTDIKLQLQNSKGEDLACVMLTAKLQ